jgi:hypothetical protein
MLRRTCDRYNLLPLLWAFNLIVHLLLKWIQDPKIWITFLSVTFPVIGYLLVAWLYRFFSDRDKLSSILPPELPGVIGLLYAQPTYMIVLKLALEGGKSISLKEALKTIGVLTPTVPVSTIVISTYDGTLVAVPLTCLVMLLAGRHFRRKYKRQSLSANDSASTEL